MCLLGISFQSMPDNPLLILANREEAFSRPATGPIILPAQGESPAWLGGVDLQAGGTWLGINSYGLLVAVTNRRRSIVPIEPRSRGLLCRSLLAFRSVAPAARAAIEQLRGSHYAGCNLLLATRDEATTIEFGEELLVTPLPPGLHLITNAALNDPADARIARVRNELERAAPQNPTAWGIAAKRICALRRDADGPAICLEGHDRGTVSSTVLTLANRPDDSHYWHVSRPATQTGYVDHTSMFHGLIAGSTAAIGAHRIHLRGPWRFEPIARAAQITDGQVGRSHGELPGEGTVQLPTPWSAFLPAFRGRVAFQRRFHRPNNLEPHERVDIVLEGVNGSGRVSLNGRSLGGIDEATHSFRCDVTRLLSGNDELLVDLEILPSADEVASFPPWQTAAVEIQSSGGVVDSQRP